MGDRTMSITTPLGGDVLLFNTMSVTEELGRLPRYDITVLSEKKDIDPDKLLGQHVTVHLELPDDSLRHYDAHVVRFALAGKRGRYYRYSMVARPWLWFLTRSSDCRIFQDLKVHQIIDEIFSKYKAKAVVDKLKGKDGYRKREYCVQYRETDFNFVSRLMEEEGIYYFIKHSDGKHEVVLCDSASSHDPSPNNGSLPYVDPDRMIREDKDHISAWTFAREIPTGAYVLEDYNFETPSVDLQVKRVEKRQTPDSSYEFYDYAANYLDDNEGKHYVQVRLEELQTGYETADAITNARGLCTGELFKLNGYPRSEQNREYLVVSMQQQLEFSDYESLGDSPTRYNCTFSALASKEPFRARCVTPKPVVQGVQPAVVVGPAGAEIYTDKYGRVAVQFFWDRRGKKDAKSSCFIRVSHPWAGKNFGMIHTPRIGQEVVVDFVEGDPDRPLITGRVYNAEQMPPWDLPGNMTQSGILTRSSKGGTPANANALRFEDKKGAEQVWLHAEKNQDIEVENDETHWVGHDRTKTIDHDETTHVKHDRTETVDNNETITVHGNRTETVDKNETITVHQNRTETVDQNETITVSGNRTHTVSKNETKTVSMNRTHTVGINEAITIGAAQEITVGAAQTITVGAAQAITVGANQTTTVGGDQSNSVSGDQTESVSGDAARKVSGDETIAVSGDRKKNVDGNDATKVAKTFAVVSDEEIAFKTGDASITMKKDGTIVIKGKDITIQGSGKINVKADSDIVMKGSKIEQN